MATKRTKTASDSRKKGTELARMQEMSAIDILEADHRQVEEFFGRMKSWKMQVPKNSSPSNLYSAPGSQRARGGDFLPRGPGRD
jgi:hypothetical protein